MLKLNILQDSSQWTANYACASHDRAFQVYLKQQHGQGKGVGDGEGRNTRVVRGKKTNCVSANAMSCT